MRFLLVGTPGTGKSTLLRQLEASYDSCAIYEANSLIHHAEALYGTEGGSEEDKSSVQVVDDLKLVRWLDHHLSERSKEDNSKIQIVASHLEGLISPNVFDAVIVLKCSPMILRKRLVARGYPDKQIEENIQAEIMEELKIPSEYYFQEQEAYLLVDTSTLGIDECAKVITNFLESQYREKKSA